MARIKFTGPPAAVQMQQNLMSNTTIPTKSKSQVEPEKPLHLTLQERLSLKQQQSLEMVQVMLHVSLGTLFYLREFLPLGCFEDRDLKQAQREQQFSYEKFINGGELRGIPGDNSEPAFGKGRKGQPLKIILRNSDPKADMILDLLENGIFDALSRNVLEAIQLTILVDQDTPDHVLESYTFSFKYSNEPGDMGSRLESLSLDPVGCIADMKTAQTARMGLEMIVRRLITLSAFLPTLPNKRNLGIHLFYTKDCPTEYEPPGFSMASENTIKYPFHENWRKESQSCGTMNSGFHTVGLQVTSLKWNGPDPEGSEAPPKIPLQMEYTDEVERGADPGFTDEEYNTINSLGSRNSSFLEATQDVTERQRLQMMMIPTQVTSYTESDLTPTQPLKLADGNNVSIPGTSQKLLLSQRKTSEINASIRSQSCKSLEITRDQGGTLVRCQCGWDGEEPGMIECFFCHTRQHMICYGFQGFDDPRLPNVHACYQCLLEPAEAHLLHEMNTLVLLRRALRIILGEGFPNRTSIFTQKLHCNGQTVIQITELLKKQDFLQPTPGNKSKGFLQKGLPKFIIPDSEHVRLRMEREILNPMAKIRHHYVQQDTGTHLDDLENQEPDLVNEPYPSINGITMTEHDSNDLETQCTDDAILQLSESSPNYKRKSTQDTDELDESDDLNVTQETSSTRKDSRQNIIDTDPQNEAQHDNVNAHMASSQDTTQSNSQISNGLRRSSRKRRKISNYLKLIDVGAATSGDESI